MDGWNNRFLFGWSIFRGELLVSRRVSRRQRDRSTNGCLEHVPFPENFHASTNPWIFNCYGIHFPKCLLEANDCQSEGWQIRDLANDCPSDA